MNKYTTYCWVFLILIVVTGCFDKDIFSDTPKIAFEDIVFVDAPDRGDDRAKDTLFITFSFQDGNGDIGLDAVLDMGPPYHLFNGTFDSLGNAVVRGADLSDYTPPFYSIPMSTRSQVEGGGFVYYPRSAKFLSTSLSLPNDDCDNYQVVGEDQVFGSKNPFHNNIIVTIEKKVNGNTYESLEVPSCASGFNGRIPFFDPDAREGVITYEILSSTFKGELKDDTSRVRFYIYDRALNKSNEVFSKDFVLSDITNK